MKKQLNVPKFKLKDEEFKSTCSVCGPRLKEEKITYTQEISGKFFIVENVTAQVCPQCGEEYLSPEIVEGIRELIESKKKPLKTREVPVYSLT